MVSELFPPNNSSGRGPHILANTKEILSIYSLRIEMHRSVIVNGDDLINSLEKEPGERYGLVRLEPIRKNS